MKDLMGEQVDDTFYKQLVGSLMYSTSTRPDLLYVVSLLSRYMAHPTTLHLQAAKCVLRYIKGTTTFSVFYRQGGNHQLVGYFDSDYAGDVEDRRSTLGYLILLSSRVVSWSSRKRPAVSLSTTEAKFVAASCLCMLGRMVAEDDGAA